MRDTHAQNCEARIRHSFGGYSDGPREDFGGFCYGSFSDCMEEE
jgi:hypothetical protein